MRSASGDMPAAQGTLRVVSDVDVLDEVSDARAVAVLIVIPAFADHTQTDWHKKTSR